MKAVAERFGGGADQRDEGVALTDGILRVWYTSAASAPPAC